MPNRNINRIFDNVDEGFGAVFDAARAGNETTSRIYRFTIDEMQRTQQERSDLAKQWIESPMDVAGLSRAVFETWQRRGRRRAGLIRSAIGEVVEAGREARTAAVAVANAGGSAAQAGFRAGREGVEETSKEVRREAEKLGERVGDAADDAREGVRRAVREASETRDEVIRDLTAARASRNGGGSRASASRPRKPAARPRKTKKAS
jgi:hypothetical protein